MKMILLTLLLVAVQAHAGTKDSGDVPQGNVCTERGVEDGTFVAIFEKQDDVMRVKLSVPEGESQARTHEAPCRSIRETGEDNYECTVLTKDDTFTVAYGFADDYSRIAIVTSAKYGNATGLSCD